MAYKDKSKTEKLDAAEEISKLDKKKMPRLLRGFKDVLPEDEKYWDLIFNTVRDVARGYGFARISTPTLEEARLFERTSGESSDIASKELFRFSLPSREDDEETAGKEARPDPTRQVALRPEGTAPIVRAYLEHGMVSQPQPVKLWDFGPMYRYDRPQAGRYRQFWQWSFEVLGEESPIVDAQIIIMTYNVYKTLGLDVIVPINSIGDNNCRPTYIENLKGYLQPKSRQLCSDCRARVKTNPLRVFDCKEEACQQILVEAPQIIDWLCEDCRNHFVEVLELLDEIEVPYTLDPRLVRGLDYYSRTAFEFFLKDQYESGSKLLALGGGGRYDGMAEVLGGRSVPAVGTAPGVERAVIAMKQRNVVVPPVLQVDLFLASLGREARRKALRLYEELRSKGFRVAEHFAKEGLSAQLEKADKVGAQLTLILGQKEMLDGTILLRDMSSGIQEEINFDKILNEIEKRISKVTVRQATIDTSSLETDPESAGADQAELSEPAESQTEAGSEETSQPNKTEVNDDPAQMRLDQSAEESDDSSNDQGKEVETS